LNTIVFSIDYRLSPAYNYPDGLDDCWQAYNWIITHCFEFFQITPNKIVLTGDSAGGNLAIGFYFIKLVFFYYYLIISLYYKLALTAYLIKQRGRIPDGLLICYPALSLDLNRFTPSYLIGKILNN